MTGPENGGEVPVPLLGPIPVPVPCCGSGVTATIEFGHRSGLLRDFDGRHGLWYDFLHLNGDFDAMPADFNPDVLPAASRYDAEGLTRREGGRPKIVLHGANVVQYLARLEGQQLVEHPFHGFQGERTGRKVQVPCGGDDIRALARMKDERVPIGADDGGQQRVYKRHSSPTGISRSP